MELGLNRMRIRGLLQVRLVEHCLRTQRQVLEQEFEKQRRIQKLAPALQLERLVVAEQIAPCQSLIHQIEMQLVEPQPPEELQQELASQIGKLQLVQAL